MKNKKLKNKRTGKAKGETDINEVFILSFIFGLIALSAFFCGCIGEDGTQHDGEKDDDKNGGEDYNEEITEQQSKKAAGEFIENSPTYKFDGYDLEYVETLYPDIAGCENCYQFVYKFNSRHSGYGDRQSQMLAQVITPHEAVITMENGKITAAVLDSKWDIINQLYIDGEEPIGGERDAHGCLGPAGYSWNESVGACIREWELDENQKKAAKIAVEPLSFYVTVISVDVARCPGCFIVNLQRNDDNEHLTFTVILENWKIKNQELTEEVCESAGGNWNNCSSKCRIDNQGNEDVLCPAVCEALCECGGIAGYACPAGYTCKMPEGIADALGYCVPDEKTSSGDENKKDCESDSDCIPIPSECHPMECINKKYENEYTKPKVCTEIFMMEAAYKPDDCVCVEGKCMNKNIGRMSLEGDNLTPTECLHKGGRVVNIVGGGTCSENEIKIGDVEGFISPNICCLVVDSFDDCLSAGYPVMESYPRQCRTPDGDTFTEDIKEPVEHVEPVEEKKAEKHTCTEEEKKAEICTMEYAPVCGFKSDGSSKTYSNGCMACADKADYWIAGECAEKMSIEDALKIAEESECTEKGQLTNSSFYNAGTRTWWIDLDMKPEFKKDYCSPACVVFEDTKTAEINWRCTGALPP